MVELAVVLVIMGLLVAGAVSGRELIKIAELKGIITEAQGYKIAIESFKGQYEGLPGDLSNATSFWTSGTANGNDDGYIGTGVATDDTEVYYAWDQLALAKMVPGVYSGAGTAAVIGTNVPQSEYIKNSGLSLSYLAAPFSYADALSRNFPANYIILGKNHAGNNYLSTATLAPEDAYYIDNKIDDSTPDFGGVLGGTGDGASGTCTSGSAPNIIYNFTNTGVSCTVMFTAASID